MFIRYRATRASSITICFFLALLDLVGHNSIAGMWFLDIEDKKLARSQTRGGGWVLKKRLRWGYLANDIHKKKGHIQNETPLVSLPLDYEKLTLTTLP